MGHYTGSKLPQLVDLVQLALPFPSADKELLELGYQCVFGVSYKHLVI